MTRPCTRAIAGRHLLGAALLAIAAIGLLRLAVLVLALQDPDIGLQVDEAQYWNWSQHLQWGYFSKPPGIAVLIATTTALAGDSLLAIKAVGLLLYPATALVLAGLAAALARRHAGADPARAAALAALVLLVSPMAGLLGLAATTDAPLLLTWALATALLWRLLVAAPGDRLRPTWLALGAVIGAGLLSKYTFAAWLPGAVLLWGLQARAQRRPWLAGPLLAGAVLVALLLPHLAWNAAHGWPTLQHTAEITVASSAKAPLLQRLFETLAGPALMLGPLWLLWLPVLWRARQVGPAVVIGSTDGGQPSARRFLVVLHAPLALAGLAQGLASGVQVNWTAPLALVFSLGLALALSRPWAGGRSLRVALGLTLALHLAVGVVVPLAEPLWRQAQSLGWVQRPLPRNLDIWGRMRGWAALHAPLQSAAERHWASLPVAPSSAAPADLLGTDRTVVAHGTYLWRDRPVRWRAPRLDRLPHDHYQLTAGWPRPGETTPLLILHEGREAELPEALRARLVDPVLLARSEVPQGSQRTLLLQLWSARTAPGGQP